jgi:hypothetical protein
MNIILKDLIFVLLGIIGGYLFIKIRQKVINQTKEVVGEKFSLSKFSSGMLNIVSPVGWAKDIASIFNLRKLIIIGIIIGCIYGYGWYRGQQGKPVMIDLKGKEEFIKLNEHYLHIQKDGSMQVLDKDKKTVLKDIKVKDLDNLRKYLRPYGFKFEPVLVAGLGASISNAGFEGGIGVRYFKWFKWVTDVALTNKGFYPLGISYKLTENSAIGLSTGTGFQKEERGLFSRFLLKFTNKF